MSKRALLAVLGALAFSLGSAAHAVDVNNADEAALRTIKGIGPATAGTIIEERSRNGPYKDADDFAQRVKGVGPKSVVRLQEQGLSFGSRPATAAKKDARPDPKAGAKAVAKPAR
ncbi:ComEA family DNA-binding protein [Cupriavidus malaysiensis]|uniref:Helix-hairpin-helix domain-containing protein n=1 Tax=Cupriavidus malaysiensis TaxID=367825 RepID=A0ABM6F2X5_9BURK|nr:helix-hairpin-helix domain-containing protein [Cupriavidus malaysiensis]AOZ05476.1 hypothetical protein BKK80_06415 [Cupriavidus malaysiensis]